MCVQSATSNQPRDLVSPIYHSPPLPKPRCDLISPLPPCPAAASTGIAPDMYGASVVALDPGPEPRVGSHWLAMKFWNALDPVEEGWVSGSEGEEEEGMVSAGFLEPKREERRRDMTGLGDGGQRW